MIDETARSNFIRELDTFYASSRRELPWRDAQFTKGYDPYIITVSEVMLQQTQASRVQAKFLEFLKLYPSAEHLAAATSAEVLAAWSGLGYNRRGKYLHDFARHIAGQEFPATIEALTNHSGIGYNTAAAIVVYSFNEPHVFIETNVRTVYLHHFFEDADMVADRDILPVVAATLDTVSPREFYYALMDYGTHLKKLGHGNKKSKHYKKQADFKGSLRQVRGRVIALLVQFSGTLALDDIRKSIDSVLLEEALAGLQRDSMITITRGVVSIP